MSREPMSEFYEAWLIKLEELYHQLADFTLLPTTTPDYDQKCSELIGKAMRHYRRYYSEKRNVAREDAFYVLSVPWMTSFERSLSWVSGLRPMVVFSFITNSVKEELTPEQEERLEAMKDETRMLENDIETRLAQAQERVAGQRMVNLIRRFGWASIQDDEPIPGLDDALDEIKAEMLVTIESGDALLGSTMRKVMEVLNPLQSVKLFAVSALYVIRIRRLGILKDEASNVADPGATATAAADASIVADAATNATTDVASTNG